MTLRTVSRGLRQEGFEVFTAASGEDALTIFAQQKRDLTLLDIVLPGIDGRAQSQKLQAPAKSPKIPPCR
jgi:DNA-binding response OmpR family regulator